MTDYKKEWARAKKALRLKEKFKPQTYKIKKQSSLITTQKKLFWKKFK